MILILLILLFIALGGGVYGSGHEWGAFGWSPLVVVALILVVVLLLENRRNPPPL